MPVQPATTTTTTATPPAVGKARAAGAMSVSESLASSSSSSLAAAAAAPSSHPNSSAPARPMMLSPSPSPKLSLSSSSSKLVGHPYASGAPPAILPIATLPPAPASAASASVNSTHLYGPPAAVGNSYPNTVSRHAPVRSSSLSAPSPTAAAAAAAAYDHSAAFSYHRKSLSSSGGGGSLDERNQQSWSATPPSAPSTVAPSRSALSHVGAILPRQLSAQSAASPSVPSSLQNPALIHQLQYPNRQHTPQPSFNSSRYFTHGLSPAPQMDYTGADSTTAPHGFDPHLAYNSKYVTLHTPNRPTHSPVPYSDVPQHAKRQFHSQTRYSIQLPPSQHPFLPNVVDFGRISSPLNIVDNPPDDGASFTSADRNFEEILEYSSGTLRRDIFNRSSPEPQGPVGADWVEDRLRDEDSAVSRILPVAMPRGDSQWGLNLPVDRTDSLLSPLPSVYLPSQSQWNKGEVTNSTHSLILHAPNDPIPSLIAGRPVVEVTILLGARGHRAPSLLMQLSSQQPPSDYPQLRLIASSSNRYAGVGEYWDAASARVSIEGNVPLRKSVKRLKAAVARSERVREHVNRNGDISLTMMGVMTSTCEDLCASTEEMRVDFEGEGGVVGILATCQTWIYYGSDGAAATPDLFEPIWEKQYTVSARVANVRTELVDPITDFVTPFATAMSARSRARLGDATSAMMTLLTYETRHGGPKVAHWIVLRTWGCGSGALREGDSLDASWIAAESATRGAPSHILSTVSTSVPSSLDFSLLPDTTGTVAWSLFSRVFPPLQVVRVRGITGVQLQPGEYHVIGGVETTHRTVTQMDALQRVIATVGSKTAPRGVRLPSHARRNLSFSTKRSRIAFSALGGIMVTRGKREAVRSLLAATSLVSRMSLDRLEAGKLVVRRCEGGFLVHPVGVQEAVATFAASGQTLSWLCLSGGKIRLMLVCSGDRGHVRTLGTATFVGTPVGPPDGVGVLIS
ncbi:hypothetical protein DFJ73DRAFT_964082 [Zopfochytrium polystomum]|nr:hypothetical protein DFJ73DRAFT_964082 [Zopfochytrium polystomum]